VQRWALAGIGALGLGALVTLAGCPANLDNPQRFEDGGNAPPADNIPSCLVPIFSKSVPPGKCAGNGCHSAGGTLELGGDLDLTSPGVTQRLVNANATHAGADMDGGGCPPAKLIDTATPMNSWLLKKINGAQGSCGSTMPQVGSLTPAEKACITQYVMDAASSAGGTGSMTMGGSGGSSAMAGTAATLPAGGNGGAAAAGGGAGGAGAGGRSGGSGGASGGASGSAGTGGT
jgi:hypothetical protein